MRQYRFWTPDEFEAAKAMRAAGATYVEIGRKLNRKPGAVAQAFDRMGGAFQKLGRTCSECPTPISDTNKCGKCRRCNLTAQNHDAAFQAARLPALVASHAVSAGSPHRRRAAKAAAAKRMARPGYREWLVRQMKEVVQPKSRTPEAIAKRDMKAVGDKLRERYLGWCPEEYRDEYRRLMRSKGMNAREARECIKASIRAATEALSPFERQMRALERGGKIVANDARPAGNQIVRRFG